MSKDELFRVVMEAVAKDNNVDDKASSLKVKPAAHNGLSVGSSPTLPTSFPDSVNGQITDSVTQAQREKPSWKDYIILAIINPIAILALLGIAVYHFFG